MLSHFEPPKFNIALAIHVYDNAVALGPRDCCEKNFNPLITVPRSDLRAALRWVSSKKFSGENTLNLARFRNPFQFERQYLRNGQRYPKSENYLFDSISFRVG